jgi:hypothetical protein
MIYRDFDWNRPRLKKTWSRTSLILIHYLFASLSLNTPLTTTKNVFENSPGNIPQQKIDRRALENGMW